MSATLTIFESGVPSNRVHLSVMPHVGLLENKFLPGNAVVQLSATFLPGAALYFVCCQGLRACGQLGRQ